jgi:hypothetical protein
VSNIVNLWVALSQQGLDEYKAKRAAIRDGTEYTGPMDNKTFKILSAMADTDTVQRMFKTVAAGGKVYTLFSLYAEGTTSAQNALDYLQEKWPNHFLVIGCWWMDGRQCGTEWEYDASGNLTGGVTGAPLYPIHAQAWKTMPDIVEYDASGNEISRVAATSNADLRDINVLQGQEPRRFA